MSDQVGSKLENKMKIPILGSYAGPSQNELRQPRGDARKEVVEPPKQKKMVTEKKEEFVQEQKKEEKEIPEKTKEQAYTDTLAEFNISKEEARAILDGIFCNNYYEESGVIANRVRYTIRTRQGTDLDRVLAHLENMEPRMAMSSQDIIANYNLAASLKQYNDTVFDFPVIGVENATAVDVEDAFEKRLNFVKSLVGPAVEVLLKKVSEFDIKIAAVTADGAPEDF